MPWQILLFINLVAATVRETLNKRIANRLEASVGLFYITLIECFLFFILQVLFFHTLPIVTLPNMFAGVLFVITFVCYFKAVKISLSQSILFQSYSILVTIILVALFLGEKKYFDLTTIIGIKIVSGIVLALISLWYILHENNKKKEKLGRRWFLYMILTDVSMGLGSFISLYSFKTLTSLEIFFAQSIVMAPILYFLTRLSKSKLRISRIDFLTTLLNTIFSTISIVAFFEILHQVGASILYPIQQILLVILTMISGILFFNEKNILKGRRLVGIFLGLIGILLLGSVS